MAQHTAQHNVTEEYKRYFRKDFKRRQKGKSGLTPPPNPFGTSMVPDPDQPGQLVERPIQGPPNWDQIWDYDTMGHDARRTIPATGNPLNKTERRYIRQNGGSLQDIQFTKKIGGGGFGQIWAVTATKNGINEKMACKLLKPKDYGGPNFQESMDFHLGDMRALRLISHSNIVQMNEVISIPDMRSGFPYSTVLLFTELCDGDLYDLLDDSLPDRLFPEPLCRHWFRQIGTGLQFLHDEGIVHLDIKPENIFYVYDNDINRQMRTGNPLHMTFKLGDFGLSMQFLDNSQRFMIREKRGTHIYMATEMRGYIAYHFDSRAGDVYSLGVTLARSILGRNDFAYYVPNLYNEMLLAKNLRTSNLNISPEAAKLIAAMIHPTNHMRARLPIILYSSEWMTKNITNPRRVRSVFTNYNYGPLFALPRSVLSRIYPNLALPVVLGIGALIAFTVLRRNNLV